MRTSFITTTAILISTISKAFGAPVVCECVKESVDFLEVAKAGVVFGVIGITILCSPLILELYFELRKKRRRKKFWEQWEKQKKESERKFYEELWKR